MRLPLVEGETVGDLLRRLDIALEEISHIFLNGKLLFSRSSMAPWLGYVREREWTARDFNPLEVKVRPGDRLGIFPRDMGMLVANARRTITRVVEGPEPPASVREVV